MTDLGRQIADLMHSIDPDDPQEIGRLFVEALKEKFPQARRDDVLRAQRIYEEDRRAEREKLDSDMAELERILAFFDKHHIPSGTPFRDAVTKVAATGNPEALAYLDELNNPQGLGWLAVFDAAVERHPNWERDDTGHYICRDETGPQGTPESLVDWFQLTFPKEARVLEDHALRAGQ
jgi:hypothetical protein